jgi:hypothetical protein
MYSGKVVAKLLNTINFEAITLCDDETEKEAAVSAAPEIHGLSHVSGHLPAGQSRRYPSVPENSIRAKAQG